MNTELRERVETLRADYESCTDQPWNYFLCPILFRDEETQLCRAHVINKAFQDSDRSWTVQRAEVDSRFGTLFEKDFLAIENARRLRPDEMLADEKLAREFNARIRHDGTPLDHYVPSAEPVPKNFSEVTLDGPNGPVRLALKVPPEGVSNSLDGKWEIAVEKDVRLPSLVSLLKAAHLTLFHLLGYRYALSAGGRFIGFTVLGDFFLKTRDMERTRALEEARSHFGAFVNLVRPVDRLSWGSSGTLTDRTLLLCTSGDRPWAMQVLIRTAHKLHVVLIPLLDDADSAERFFRFLKSPFSSIDVKFARFNGGLWELSSVTGITHWPEADLDGPMKPNINKPSPME